MKKKIKKQRQKKIKGMEQDKELLNILKELSPSESFVEEDEELVEVVPYYIIIDGEIIYMDD